MSTVKPQRTTVDLLALLEAEFPRPPPSLDDEYIVRHPDPTCAEPKGEWLVLMPAYMSWCLRSPLRDKLLVVDHTGNALANFGRFTEPVPSHMNFRSLCNQQQREVVVGFLRWCLSGQVLIIEDQVQRSLKRWQEV
jgi:hypothetical protein